MYLLQLRNRKYRDSYANFPSGSDSLEIYATRWNPANYPHPPNSFHISY